MSNDDPFTLDLFGNTALSSGGLGLGITPFGSDFGAENLADDQPTPPAGSDPHARPVSPATGPGRGDKHAARRQSFFLESDRGLARGWKQRASDNLDAIRLAAEIEADERPATPEEQARLIRFTGFGASDLANGVFRRPGETAFRDGWDEIGAELEDAVPAMTMPPLPAAPNTPTSPQSSSSGRCGRACCTSAGAAAECSNPASARVSSPP
jgi:hypothetical protein